MQAGVTSGAPVRPSRGMRAGYGCRFHKSRFRTHEAATVSTIPPWAVGALAVVGLFAGEMGSAGGCHVNIPRNALHPRYYLAGSNFFPGLDPVLLIPLIVVAA